MPKVIDNVRKRAIAEAGAILQQKGYDALKVRDIAKNLGIGLGTFYNYFPSKEYLAACVMLEDWQRMTESFEKKLTDASPEQVICGLFDLVRTFSLRYVPAWTEYELHGSSRTMIRQYHDSLVRQLSGYLENAIPAGQQAKEPWLAESLSEIILRFGADSIVPYERIAPAVLKLLGNEQTSG